MAVGSVVQGLSPSVFMTLFEPQVRMAIWSRTNPAPPDLLVGDLIASCDGAWTSSSDQGSDWLMDDIRMLGHFLAAFSGSETWRARLETVQDRVCPRFHQDATSLRLITAYAGRGPEWAFARELGDDLDAGEAETKIRIRTLAPGDVALMKGSAPGWEPWPDFPIVLHRSPPASPRTPRLLLTIDPEEPPPFPMESDDLAVA